MGDFRVRLYASWLGLRRTLRWKARPELPRLLEAHGKSADATALRTVSKSERDAAPGYERCQVCSLCTFSCIAVREGTAPPAFEPKLLVLGPGRALGDGELTWELWVPCATCNACTVECPNDVPVHRIAEAIANRLPR